MQRCMGCMKEYSKKYDVCPHCGCFSDAEPENKAHLIPGTMLENRYIIGRAIGHGGFGITYIALDAKIEKTVAVKELFPNAFSTRSFGDPHVSCYNNRAEQFMKDGIRKMLEEARRISRFSKNKNIVDIYDFFESNNTAYIVMEYLEGTDLKKYLEANGGRLSPEKAVEIILPVLNALEDMHRERIVHRDISPDNIFLCDDGNIKLLDFGSARLAVEDDEKSLSVMVKRGYAPKEQYASRSKQGPWTDVYAVSATLYKLITGITPPDSMERDFEPLKTFAELGIEGCDELEKILHKGLELNYEERIQSVGELRKLLRSFSTAKPVAKPVSVAVKPEPEVNLSEDKNKTETKKSKQPKFKKNNLIKILVIVFAVVIAVGPIVSVMINRSYTLDENGVLTIKNDDAMVDYDMGEAPWFEQRNQITSVVISDGVTRISDFAFCGCNNLTSVTIPDSVITIGDDAFFKCDSLTSITIPDGVTTIGDSAFSYCNSLTSITIPDSITSIGDSSFESCISLTSITVPDSVITIEGKAFFNCTNLKSIRIPDSVTSIGGMAFSGCLDLKNVYYTGSEFEWAEIEFGYDNSKLNGVNIHYNSY